MSQASVPRPHRRPRIPRPRIQIRKGLAGVVADTTAISKVNPDTNSLLYRGYPVQELAARCTLRGGRVPALARRAADRRRARRPRGPRARSPRDAPARSAPRSTSCPTTAHPMDVLRTAVSVLGAEDPAARGPVTPRRASTSPSGCSRRCRRSSPTTSADGAARSSVEPREDLGYAENFLHMTFGEVPDDVVVDAFRVSLVLYAEHSFNASTFTARVITSTLSDLYSAVVGAIGALKGAAARRRERGGHGARSPRSAARTGPRSGCGTPSASKRKIMGFGHRVYKHGDSRVPTMKAALDRLVEHYGRPELAELYDRLEAAMRAREGHRAEPRLPVRPAYHLMGFDTATFTPLFVAARIAGLDGARHGAACEQLPHPAALRLPRAGRAARGGLSAGCRTLDRPELAGAVVVGRMGCRCRGAARVSRARAWVERPTVRCVVRLAARPDA